MQGSVQTQRRCPPSLQHTTKRVVVVAVEVVVVVVSTLGNWSTETFIPP